MKRPAFHNLIILTLLTLFLAGAGFVVINGAQFYTRMISENDASLTQQTVMLYFNQRLKTHDASGQITLMTQSGKQVLVFEADGFYTLIYEDRGHLVEQSSETPDIDRLAAEPIAPLSALALSLSNHQLTVRYTDEAGQIITLRYTLMREEDPA
jgi:hypothetical protein